VPRAEAQGIADGLWMVMNGYERDKHQIRGYITLHRGVAWRASGSSHQYSNHRITVSIFVSYWDNQFSLEVTQPCEAIGCH